jgi:hypothetical protein
MYWSQFYLIIWAFAGIFILSFIWYATLSPWQYKDKHSVFSINFFLKKIYIYDIPREAQMPYKEQKRTLQFYKLLETEFIGLGLCTLVLLTLHKYLSIVFIIWTILFILFPILSIWYLYYEKEKKNEYKERKSEYKVFRSAFLAWAWCILISTIYCFAKKNYIMGNIIYKIPKLQQWLGLPDTASLPVLLILALLTLSHMRTTPFEKEIRDMCKELKLNEVNTAEWAFWMNSCYIFGAVYSIIILLFNI